jgi:hypothetical protein
MNALRAAGLAWIAPLAVGCGAQSFTEAQTNEAFGRMQVGEARVVSASRSARDESRPCDERAAASEEGCDAAEAVCDEAAPLDDADADARCEDARDTCADVSRRVRASCDPPSGSDA